ncbi:MAG: hypothetical protein KAU20_02830 [Nanoarchaeota archaeon]|nr:hypothetical protein [Nanoarchaeota archaeon]
MTRTKRTTDEIRKKMLDVLSNGKVYSFSALERKVNTSSQSIRANCKAMEKLNFIKIIHIPAEESGSGRASYTVKITDEGLKWLDKLKKI